MRHQKIVKTSYLFHLTSDIKPLMNAPCAPASLNKYPCTSGLLMEKKNEKTSFTQFVVLTSTNVARLALAAGKQAFRQPANPYNRPKAYELLKGLSSTPTLKTQFLY